jgi:hydantoinase/carbamoylase family amidase
MNINNEDLLKSFDAKRMSFLIDKFSQIGIDESGGVTRLAFSQEDLKAREEFIDLLAKELKLKVRTDALGNIFARREGRHSDWPVIMTGSHLDTVRHGGKFDGPAGVFSSLEAFRAMDQLNLKTEHPFELVVLTSEEPNTFGISTFGSRGLVGLLTKKHLEPLRDDQGKDIRSALEFIGGDLDRIEGAIRKSGEIEFFVELHIEQMPYLDREKKDIGVVDGITGIYREAIFVNGVASHCGTTPMDGRRDALCAASEIILALETAARAENGHAVATIGHITVFPNSINITPKKVVLDAEIRSFYPDRIRRIIGKMADAISAVKKARNVEVDRRVTYDSPPTNFSTTVTKAIKEAAESLGFKTKNLISMAGHDASHMNRIAAAGMIFIPSKDGLSHCPEEYTEIESIIKGSQCLLKTLLKLDQIKRR